MTDHYALALVFVIIAIWCAGYIQGRIDGFEKGKSVGRARMLSTMSEMERKIK